MVMALTHEQLAAAERALFLFLALSFVIMTVTLTRRNATLVSKLRTKLSRGVVCQIHRTTKPRDRNPLPAPVVLNIPGLSLVEVRRVFRVTDELCQDAHTLDEERPNLVDLHGTESGELCAYKAQSIGWKGGRRTPSSL